MKIIFGVGFLSVLIGCSNQLIYENIQHHQREECAKQPPSQYEECMAAASKSYDEYQRELEEVREGD